MKTSIVLAAGALLFAFAAPAFAAEPPKFTASCPTGIEVKSNGKGKVRINGNKAQVKPFNDTAWEAHGEGVTLDITTEKNGSGLIVSYTLTGGGNGGSKGKGTGKPVASGGNGICQVTSSGPAAGSSGDSNTGKATLSDVPAKDQQACLAAVSNKTNNGTVTVLSAESSEANNSVVIGVGKDKAKWRCLVKNGRVDEVMSLTDEGAL